MSSSVRISSRTGNVDRERHSSDCAAIRPSSHHCATSHHYATAEIITSEATTRAVVRSNAATYVTTTGQTNTRETTTCDATTGEATTGDTANLDTPLWNIGRRSLTAQDVGSNGVSSKKPPNEGSAQSCSSNECAGHQNKAEGSQGKVLVGQSSGQEPRLEPVTFSRENTPGEYDVLIVGGGPAGSSCAWRLHRAGMRVGVMDKAVFPRDKPCAGWITPQIVEELQLDVDGYRQGRVWQPILGFRCGLVDGPAVEVHYREPISFGIRRCEFDTYLLERSGAECLLGEAVTDIQRQGSRWVINGTYRAAMLVGAGGHFCPVARWLGARRNCRPVVTAQEVEFRAEPGDAATAAVRADMPELYFCRDLLGYGWCFRKEDFFNIGLGRLASRALPESIRDFCRFLHDTGRYPASIPNAFRGHAYLLYQQTIPPLYSDGVLLVGDSAGLAFRQSGEGIRPAVESGLLAAETILRSHPDYSAPRLAAYAQKIHERFGRPVAARRSWLPQSWLAALGRGLLRSRWFTKHVVMERWFLHRNQPALTLS